MINQLRERFFAYRPAAERTFLGLALVGLLVVAHLAIQEARSFQDGCFGLFAQEAGMAFHCAALTQSASGTLLGLANTVWGMGFFGLVAVLTFVRLAWASSRWMLGVGRAVVITGGLVYALYLAYVQVAVVDAVCILCLASGVVTLSLFGIQAASSTGLVSSSSPITSRLPDRMFRREIALFTYLVALTVVLAGADLTYFQTTDGQLSATTSAAEVENSPNGENSASEKDAASEEDAVSGEDSPKGAAALVAQGITSAAIDTTGGACEYDAQKPAVDDPRSLVGFQDPMQGSRDASVIVVEYFDPNCPHCATFHQEMKQVIESHGDQALFVYKPVPLWPYSVNQIQALYAAAQEGKFVEMMEAQFARQQRGGLNVSQLQSIAREIGMDPGVLKARIDQGRYMEQIESVRSTARQIGVSSTPTVLVNGRFVAANSRTADCLAQLIEGE